MAHVGTCAGTGVCSPGFSPPGPRWHPSRRAHSVCDRQDQAESGREAGVPRFRASVWGNPPRSRGDELARFRPSAAPSRWQSAAGREPRIALGGTGNLERVKLGAIQTSDQPLRGGHREAPPPSRSLLLLAPHFPAPRLSPLGNGAPAVLGAPFCSRTGWEYCHSGSESASCASGGGEKEVSPPAAGCGAVGTRWPRSVTPLPGSPGPLGAGGDSPQLQRAQGVRPG